MSIRLSLAGALLAVFIGGCAGAPAERFYTLATDATQPAAPNNTSKVAYSVGVGPVVLPELVDRPQLVVRLSATQVARLEQERWAAPLKSEIPRVIAANLAKLRPEAQVSTSLQNVIGNPDYQVTIDVQRFESASGEGIELEALWAVRRVVGGDARTGRSHIRETAGAGYHALVAAHSRALAVLSRDIAEVLPTAGK